MTKLLRSLAEQGHTIVATVHQPSSAIFFMFDTLCLLSRGRYAGGGRFTAIDCATSSFFQTRVAS